MLLVGEDDLWAAGGTEGRAGRLVGVDHRSLHEEMWNAVGARHAAGDVGGKIEGSGGIGPGAKPEFGVAGHEGAISLHAGLDLDDTGAPRGGREKILLAVHDHLHRLAR